MSKPKTRTQELTTACHDIRTESIRDIPSLMPYFERRARELATPEQPPVIAGGEVLPTGAEGFYIRDTLQRPDTTAVDASLERTSLLQRAGALETGLDAAKSIDARNSLEKMLAHQMATCHVAAMRIFAEATENPRPYDQNGQALMIKKLNMAARLVDTYQKGMDTLTRIRTAGKQTIEVKQIHVNGGQNVIADTVTTGGREGGRD